MPFLIVNSDITRVEADIVVNAANEGLFPGGGVCGAIFAAAGYDDMLRACEEIGGCPTGAAVATPAFRLPAKWVVHAVGPIWRGGGSGEEELLRRCYRSIFQKVLELDAASVAFPLISSGIYGYPAEDALRVVREETSRFLSLCDDIEVKLVLIDRTVLRLGNSVPEMLEALMSGAHDLCAAAAPVSAPAPAAPEPRVMAASLRAHESMDAASDIALEGLDTLVSNTEESFSSKLLSLIDASGMSDSEVYHRANISRQLFSKIRSNVGYSPSKPTAVALSLALGLTPPQMADLLSRAGYALSRSSRFDIIVMFCAEHGIYDIYRINEILFSYDQPLLGSL